MIYSLSEIDAHAKKATRGVGYSWGHAEESGKAVRYLAAQQLPGAVLLSRYLGERDAGFLPSTCRCPLLAGAQLCDRGWNAVSAWEQEPLVLPELAYPLLLLPALMLLSRESGCGVQLTWSGVQLILRGSALHLERADEASLVTPLATEVLIQPLAGVLTAGREPSNAGQDIADTVWAALERFAKRTYVPATEASRRGAGPAD